MELKLNIVKEKWDVQNTNFNLEDIVFKLEKSVRSSIGKRYYSDFKTDINDSEFIKNLKLFARGCEAYAKFLNFFSKTGNNKWTIPSTYQNREIIKMGTSLLFQMRYFLTGEELFFVVGGNTPEGALKEKQWSQKEVFGNDFLNLQVNISNGLVELSYELENLKNLEISQTSLGQQWVNILKFGLVKDYRNDGIPKGGYYKNEKYHIVYNKTAPDISVYYKWITANKKHQLSYYYDINNSNQAISEYQDLNGFLAYDRGWLYQWGHIEEKNGRLFIDLNSSRPLLPLFLNSFRENLPGIKGGDYGTEQYKYQNRTIIALTNIRNILNGGSGGGTTYKGILPSIRNFFKSATNEEERINFLSNAIADFTSYNKEEIKQYIKNNLNDILAV